MAMNRTVSFERRAILEWNGDVPRGTGRVAGGSGAFAVGATFPRVSGEPDGLTTPEEMLAASHAICFGIGLRSVLAQRGGSATKVAVTATVTAEKGGGLIRIVGSRLDAVVDGLANGDAGMLDEIARVAEQACTISALLRASVSVLVSVREGSVT